MRASLIVSLLLAGGASAALAQIGPSLPQQAPKAIVQAQTGGPVAADKKGRPGVKSPPADSDKSAVSDSLASCLAMWERATHMSKQEWARACRRVDDRLRNISVK